MDLPELRREVKDELVAVVQNLLEVGVFDSEQLLQEAPLGVGTVRFELKQRDWLNDVLSLTNLLPSRH